MKVVYIAQQGNEEPSYTDFTAALNDRFPHLVLDQDGDLASQFAGARVVVDHGGHGTRAMIDAGAAAGVELWQAMTTGLDHTEVAYILEKRIRLTNTPGAFSAVALAEHALFLMLFIAKKLRSAEQNLRAGTMYRPQADELAGSTLGLVGLGASGKELARRATAFGMRVIAVDPFPPAAVDLSALNVERCDPPAAVEQLLREADYVSLHLPLNSQTRHFIDGERLALMRPSSVLINVARGGLVDEDALVRTLAVNPGRSAGIDVFSQEPPDPASPLLQLTNVIATPHIAGTSRGTSRRRAEACVQNIERIAAGLEPLYEVTAAE